MHKTQYDEKRLALAEAGNVDDIYDLLAAHAHKVATGDQVRPTSVMLISRDIPDLPAAHEDRITTSAQTRPTPVHRLLRLPF